MSGAFCTSMAGLSGTFAVVMFMCGSISPFGGRKAVISRSGSYVDEMLMKNVLFAVFIQKSSYRFSL